MSELDKININFNEKYKNVKTKEDLQNLKSEFFGKNGIITSQFKSLNSLSPDKKKDLASTLNQIKENFPKAFSKNVLSKKALTEIVFKDKNKLLLLEKILYRKLTKVQAFWIRKNIREKKKNYSNRCSSFI